MLVTQAEITSAGTIAVTLRRWSQYASDSTSDSLSDGLSALSASRFIVIDEDTEELLVRSFVKWDGGYTNSKRQPSILAAAGAVVSPKIRAALASELTKLGMTHSLSDTPLDTPRVVVTEVDHLPQPTTLKPQPMTVVRAEARGERLTPGWKPSEELIAWARSEQIPDAVTRSEHPKFVDYWTSQPGAKGRKADWPATWRNWMRRAAEQQPRQTVNGAASQKAMDWVSIGQTPMPAIGD